VLAPEDQYAQGRTYHFTLVTKEKNSDHVMYPYYCVVNVAGEIIEDSFNLAKIPFNEHDLSEMSSYRDWLEIWLSSQWNSDYYTGSYCGYYTNTASYNQIEGVSEDDVSAFSIGHDCEDWDLSVRVVMSGATASKIIAFS
jgi:hypothetical protein